MSDDRCEVVRNQVLGKEFWYCRTHKIECGSGGCTNRPYYAYPSAADDTELDLVKEFERLLTEEGCARLDNVLAFRLRGPAYFEYSMTASGTLYDVMRLPSQSTLPSHSRWIYAPAGDWDFSGVGTPTLTRVK